jgi:hypothetical protein
MTVLIERRSYSGKIGVRLEQDDYGLMFATMRNGYQWSSFQVDAIMLSLMQDVINEYVYIEKQPQTAADGAAKEG